MLYSQDITVYNDTLGGFNVFDAGPQKQIEAQPVKSYKTGRTCIAYQDHLGQMKVYYRGKVSVMFDSVQAYFVSKCYAIGIMSSQLKIFDNGKIKIMSAKVGTYAIADSLVAFHDNAEMKFEVYNKGKCKQLEIVRDSNAITSFKAGGNVLAYIDTMKEFKMYYHGRVSKLFTLNSSLPLQYEVGQDVVAYIKDVSHSFNVYWSDKNYKLEDTIPVSFVAGNNYVAYIDKAGTFKIFTEGRVTIISKTKPDFYKVADDIIVYSEKNYFKAYYKGASYPLEKYIPGSYLYEKGTVAYKDNKGAMILFINGKKVTVTSDVITGFSLNGDLLKYNIGSKTWIFYKGKIY